VTTWQAVLLALIQGLTEFLPISSSAHLILPSELLGWPDQGLAFDVAVHVGTLLAVVVYFRREILAMSGAWWASVAHRQMTQDGRLAWAVLLGTIPVGLAGLLLKDFVEQELRSATVIAVATLFFAPLLWWGYRRARHGGRSEYQLNWQDVLAIGVAQALALIPGTSRSGATMTAGFFLGLSPQASARFSFLLSIPVIVLAGGLKGLDLVSSDHSVHWGQIGIGIVVSAFSAYASIHFFLKLLQRVGMTPFVVYRVLLGLALLWMVAL
jgi:undecaprenyl-diphosphatase